MRWCASRCEALSVAARPTPVHPKSFIQGVSHNRQILDCSAAALHRAAGLGEGIRVCHGDGFQGMASEERRCFGVRAAERSVDAALVLPE
jgi:hypothetical protein